MAKRTIESGYFGSVAMGDPEGSFVERTLAVSFDFGKKSLAKGKTIPLIEIPKGFCIDRISVVQTKAANADQAVTFGLYSDDTKQVGGSFTLSDDAEALLRASQVPGTQTVNATVTGGTTGETVTVPAPASMFCSDADVVCLILGNGESDVALTAGAFDLCIHGFETFSEGVGGNVLARDGYRDSLQTVDNVSGGQFPID